MNITDINFAIDVLSHPQSGDESDINMALDIAIKSLKALRKMLEQEPKMGCEGCIYEKTGNNSTYPCSHCGRCYTDKYKAESEDKE